MANFAVRLVHGPGRDPLRQIRDQDGWSEHAAFMDELGPLERHPSSATMWPVGWEALEQWGGDVVRGERLTGGAGVNGVWSVRVNGHLAVGRLGQRSDADLAWETGLLRRLHREGMPVPVPIPTTDGRHFADGLVVMTYAEGGPPETEADWRRVAGTLRQLHRLTRGWPQRPGWRSRRRLVRVGRSDDVSAQIDLVGVPWLVISDELSRAPNGGYACDRRGLVGHALRAWPMCRAPASSASAADVTVWRGGSVPDD
jgi:hypothetical protein